MAPSLTLSRLAAILLARWRSAALVAVAVVLAALGASLLRTPQYVAAGAVLLDVKSPDPIAGVVLPGMGVSGYMSTQAGVMQSQRVALRAVRLLKLGDNPQAREGWIAATAGRGDFDAWLADALVPKLEVMPQRESNILAVTYTSPEPQFSADVANAFVQAFVDVSVELRTDPAKQYNAFFDERAKQLRETLEQAQARLSAFQRKNGIVATDERLDVENARLTELSTQLVLLQAQASESGSRQAQSAQSPERMQEVLNSPLLVGLASDLSRQESRLTELTARLGDAHPQVTEARAGINQLRSRMAAETRRVTGSLVVNNSVNATRVAQTRAALDEQRARLLRVKGERDEAAVLARDVENSQRAYDAMVLRTGQSSVESQTTQTNVSVLRRAVAPTRPASPRVLLNVALALLFGSLLGAGTALMRERLDPRLRDDLDVAALGQPLLGALPGRGRGPGGGSRTRLTGRLPGSLPALAR